MSEEALKTQKEAEKEARRIEIDAEYDCILRRGLTIMGLVGAIAFSAYFLSKAATSTETSSAVDAVLDADASAQNADPQK